MAKITGWKLWYLNGVILNSKSNKWIECKQTEIEFLRIFYDDGTTQFFHGQEHYTLGEISISEIPKEMKLGKYMKPDEDYWNYFDIAKADPEIITEMI